MSYTDKAKIELFLNKTISEDIDFFIDAAKDIIDNITGTTFEATDPETRYFNACGGNALLIDYAIDISKVEIGDDDYGGSFTEIDAISPTQSAGYWLQPENYNERGRPASKIVLRGYNFIKGINNQKIEGKWGYSETAPDDISFAATVIAGGMYNAERGGSAGSGDIKSEKIGNYSVAYDVGTSSTSGTWASYKRALAIINKYKRYAL